MTIDNQEVFDRFLEEMISSKTIDTKSIVMKYLSLSKENDSGAMGDAFEIALKVYKNPQATKNNRVAKPNFRYGDTSYSSKAKRLKSLKIEIKSNCGELGLGSDPKDLSAILPKADFIFYCPEVAASIAMEEQAFVFSREEFLEMITTYPGTGQVVRSKPSSKGIRTLSFQSFYSQTRQTASRKLANHIWDCCYSKPTVKEWLDR